MDFSTCPKSLVQRARGLGGPGDANTGHGDGPLLDVEGPDKLYHELVELGTIWADRNAQAEYLEEGVFAGSNQTYFLGYRLMQPGDGLYVLVVSKYRR